MDSPADAKRYLLRTTRIRIDVLDAVLEVEMQEQLEMEMKYAREGDARRTGCEVSQANRWLETVGITARNVDARLKGHLDGNKLWAVLALIGRKLGRIVQLTICQKKQLIREAAENPVIVAWLRDHGVSPKVVLGFTEKELIAANTAHLVVLENCRTKSGSWCDAL